MNRETSERISQLYDELAKSMWFFGIRDCNDEASVLAFLRSTVKGLTASNEWPIMFGVSCRLADLYAQNFGWKTSVDMAWHMTEKWFFLHKATGVPRKQRAPQDYTQRNIKEIHA